MGMGMDMITATVMVMVGGGGCLRAGDDVGGGVSLAGSAMVRVVILRVCGKDRVWVSSTCLNCGYGYGKAMRRRLRVRSWPCI